MRCPALLLLAWAVTAGGCTIVGDELYPPLDDTGPRVVATFPGERWQQVPTAIAPVVWFSEPMEPNSVHLDSLSLTSGAFVQQVRYRVAVEPGGRGRVTLEPFEPLLLGVSYRLRIGAGLTDLAGNPLVDPQTVTFQTLR